MIFADKVFVNGIVVTVDDKNSIRQAIAIKDGKIIDVGTNEEIQKYVGEQTAVIDLEGKMILPAAYDSHCHSMPMGASALQYDFSFPGVDSIATMREKLAEIVKTLEPGEWIRGFGLDDENLAEIKAEPGRMISHEDFDDITPDNPFRIMLWSGHGGFINKKAMELCGITEETPDPPAGKVMRNAEGKVTGLMMEGGGLNLVEPNIPQFTDEEMEIAISNFQKMLNAEGYTGYTDATMGPADNRNCGIASARALKAYKRMSDSGRLTARVALGYYAGEAGMQSAENVEKTIDEFNFGEFNDNPEKMTLKLIKIFCDGVHMAYTAWMLNDYLDAPGNHGRSTFCGPDATDEEQLAEMQRIINVAHSRGFQIAIHAIGDRAVKNSVDCLVNAIQEMPRSDCRHYVLHAETFGNEETAAKAAKYGILYSVQPGVMSFIVEPSFPRIGEEMSKKLMGLKIIQDIGVTCCGGSDAIMGAYMNWRQSVQAIVTRKSQLTGVAHRPDLCLDVMSAIRLYTINTAYQEHAESWRGSIEIGKVADLQVIDKDIFRVNPDEIGSIEVLETYMDGELIYKK